MYLEDGVAGGGDERGRGDATSTRSVDELWLQVLHRITARVAHEIKGALNGVSVNLEVVRSRASKPDASAAAVAPFATSAGDQLEVVVSMTEALLWLARAPREPADVVETLGRFSSLLAPVARAERGSLRVEPSSLEIEGKSVRASGHVVRTLIGASMLASVARKGDIRCRVDSGEETVVSIVCADAESALELEPDIMTVAADAGVRLDTDGQSISLAFPRASSARQPTPDRA